MSDNIYDVKNIVTESDVEQKVIFPLLINDEPVGLGYSDINIQTKINLKKVLIDKGGKSKIYFPDYLILIDGMPLIIIEAKKPGEDLYEALREARLYALETNSKFGENINPCRLVLVSDGKTIMTGTWDNQDPELVIESKDWIITDEKFSDFVSRYCFSNLSNVADELKKELRKNITYNKPIHLLGGKHVQNQQINNSFGETISIQYRHLFNPTSEPERIDVVNNAYVKVQKHMSHVKPIDRLIRNSIRPSINDTVDIEDTGTPKEIINKLSTIDDYSDQVLLLIGSVGSGKSTFVTYFKEVALAPEVKEKTEWIRIDLNEAPVNSDEIYKWLKNSICIELEKILSDFDPDKFTSIMKIYKNEIESFNKIALTLFEEDSDDYRRKLFEKIEELKTDIDKKINAYIEYYVYRRGKKLIIILDNCDKRNLEEQLLMFEVANWLKNNTKSIIFLPLRETTFDHYKHQKPLDTVVKDLTFRINPPSLERVIFERVKYAYRLSDKSEHNYYLLPNGMKVHYPTADELSYLKSILTSLFQNNFFRKLFIGLAGRDIRRGIETFLDFCKSGHINDGEILKIKQSEGEYKLPNYLISRVFIRGNRLYYSDSDTKIKNIFYSDPADRLPDPFIRISILLWLNDRLRVVGPSGIKGFHRISDLLKDLTVIGHSKQRLIYELKTLIKNSIIISESQNSDEIDVNELISINTPGIVHLNLLANINYLSSCSEDVWYNDNSVAETIANRISGENIYSHFSLHTTIQNSNDLINYLENYYSNYFAFQNDIMSKEKITKPIDFSGIKKKMNRSKPSKNNITSFQSDEVISAKIVNIFDYGLICELDNSGQVGLLHISNLTEDISKYNIGKSITVEIICYSEEHKKYSLRFGTSE